MLTSLFKAPLRGVGLALSGADRALSLGSGAVVSSARVVLAAAEPVTPQAARSAMNRLAELPALAEDVVALFEPSTARAHRRVRVDGARVDAEVRGMRGDSAAVVGAALARSLRGAPWVVWWQLNEVSGRVQVDTNASASTADVLELVRAAERDAGSSQTGWSRTGDHPGDREGVLTAGLALAADAVAITGAAAMTISGVRGPAAQLAAVVALIDAQPRVRRRVEARLGAGRTDLLLAASNALANGLSGGVTALAVDGLARAAGIAENVARQTAWRAWEPVVYAGQPTGRTVPSITVASRPVPLPPGPVEHLADRAAIGGLTGAALSAATGRGTSGAASALLVAVPKASRLTREAYASTLGALLTAHGVLALDTGAWRRMDRVDALVVDVGLLLSDVPVVLAASSEPGPTGWTQELCWLEAQSLVTGKAAANSGLRLTDVPTSTGPVSGWRLLVDGDRVVGRVLVGQELSPWAEPVMLAARRAGLRVVLVGAEAAGELRSRADELVEGRAGGLATVRRLQAEGYGVAAITNEAEALSAADVGVGVLRPAPVTGGPATTRVGAEELPVMPWTADLVCSELAALPRVLAATGMARSVSARGRVLALSASTLGALILVAGPGPRSRLRLLSPVPAAALAGVLTGGYAGWRIARLPAPEPVALVPWHNLTAADVATRLRSSAGIEVTARHLALSATSLPSHGHRANGVRGLVASGMQLGHHVREELADPLTPVLSVGAAASAVLGSPADAVLVGSVMGVNALVSALQRQRASRAMSGLLDGEEITARFTILAEWSESMTLESGSADPLSAEELVVAASQLRPGDLITVRAGDVIPADARLLEADGLEVDESGLTGESVTVDKSVAATPGAALGDRTCMVFEGSVAVAGSGRAVVVAVGEATQAGRAVASVAGQAGPAGVQAQLRELTEKALPLTLLGGASVGLLGALRGQVMRAAVADGVAVAVAAVPEGLPLVATVAQLAAARRLSRRHLLVRSSRTVEALGRVDTMCFDKTGTLTEGRLRLVALADLDSTWSAREAESSADARRLLRAAARACPQPDEEPLVHATDQAVVDAARAHLARQAVHVWDPLEEVPFQTYRGYAATLGHTKRTLRLVVKGSPEVLLSRCTRVLRSDDGGDTRPLDDRQRASAQQTVHDLADQGLRVLAVARRDLRQAPADVEAAVVELTLLGFIGLSDTPRSATAPVIAELQRNNIRVAMITGDHPRTAVAIARELGIPDHTVVTGADLDAHDENGRRALVRGSHVFARVTPEHKVAIVAALQADGRVVAMTGDGSNDAAAIRRADVGIGLAAHGSAAARNAADLVLTEPDLTVLLGALAEGRAMWVRVQDAVSVLVGGNAGEVIFTLFGTAVSGRAPVGTRQFLLVNLLTDMFPAMALALGRRSASEAVQTDPPAGVEAEVWRAGAASAELAALPVPELSAQLARAVAVRAAATAGGASAAWLLTRVGPRQRASTTALVALVGAQLGQTVLVGARSPLVWTTAAASGVVLATIVQTPGLSQFFGCTPLDPFAWTTAITCAAGATVGAALARPLIDRLPLFSPPRTSPVVDLPQGAGLFAASGQLALTATSSS